MRVFLMRDRETRVNQHNQIDINNSPTPVLLERRQPASPGENMVSEADESLAQRAQKGCRDSFEELVRRHQVSLLHFLRQRTITHADAEDLTQDTFIRAYLKLPSYDNSWRFSTWLFTIARRLSINHNRSSQRDQPYEDLDEVCASEPSPIQILAEQEQRAAIWEIVRSHLSEIQGTALWLYYVQNLRIREIAHVIERSPVVVKIALFRARRKLLPLLRSRFDCQNETVSQDKLDTDLEKMTHGVSNA